MSKKNLIFITVENKQPTLTFDGYEIICGNSDFVLNVSFDEEWQGYIYKTAVFTFKRNSEKKVMEVVFEGLECKVPILSGIDEVSVGFYAGDLHTTTPVTIQCRKSILCDVTKYEDVPKNVFNQLLQLMQENTSQQAIDNCNNAATEANAAVKEMQTKWEALQKEISEQGYVTAVKELNNEITLKFWIGTETEYNSIEQKKNDVLYLLLVDNRLIMPDTLSNTRAITTLQQQFETEMENTSEKNQQQDQKITNLEASNNFFNKTLWTGSLKVKKGEYQTLEIPNVSQYSMLKINGIIYTKTDVAYYQNSCSNEQKPVYMNVAHIHQSAYANNNAEGWYSSCIITRTVELLNDNRLCFYNMLPMTDDLTLNSDYTTYIDCNTEDVGLENQYTAKVTIISNNRTMEIKSIVGVC